MPFIVKKCSSEANIKNNTKQIKVVGMVKFEQNLTSFAVDSISSFFFPFWAKDTRTSWGIA